MTFRHFLSWKSLFYQGLLPTLRALGPARADATLGATGRAAAAVWPPRRRALSQALRRASLALDAGWDVEAVRPALAGNVARFLARECLLDGADDADFFDRFDVSGFDQLAATLAEGRGLILVGCHLGAHLSAPHWLYRRNVPLRMLIQRPQHVSKRLHDEWDVRDVPHPQSSFFLHRSLSPEDASKRVFRTRAALRDGMAIYLKGDVPWVGPNTRPGRLLGQDLSFQSLWADFAGLFRAPVVPVFCTHRPGGRYALTFDVPFRVTRGQEGEAVTRYLARLDDEIRANPAVGSRCCPRGRRARSIRCSRWTAHRIRSCGCSSAPS